MCDNQWHAQHIENCEAQVLQFPEFCVLVDPLKILLFIKVTLKGTVHFKICFQAHCSIPYQQDPIKAPPPPKHMHLL